MRVARGVALVIGGGVGGYYIGKRYKHEKIGAGVGVAVGMGVNFALASMDAQTATGEDEAGE